MSGSSDNFGSSNNESARKVLVTGLPQEATESSVTIHFQKKKNGGGEIERVTLLAGGKAFIFFEDPEVAKTVVNTAQIFKGEELEVKRLGTETSEKEESRNEKRDERNEVKTISVSGLPEGSTESSVHIHFQKKKNGGGEIEKVQLVGQGKAIVVFEDPRVAKTVLNTKQIFKGKELEVKVVTDSLKNMEELSNERHDERKEQKTISVSGLPEGSTENSVYIHFQKKKNGGGEIEKVELLGQGKAIIVFDDPRVAKTVVNTKQIFKGKELEVKLGTDELNKMEELRKEKRDEKNETKTILVSGLPEESTESSVYIHFQKNKNGGGEIEKVEMLGQGKAIIIFEDPQAAKTVVNTKQILKGKELEVKVVTDTLPNMEELSNEKHDERNEPKTISVSGLPEGSTENSVHIHFQKKKNGGGEIEKVELLEQGKAIVVFEDPKVAKQVVETKQKFKGEVIHVKLVETETQLNKDTSEEPKTSDQEYGTVLVSGFPEDATENALYIHFQKKKNGGGEVKEVTFLPGKKEATVVFEDLEVAKNVVDRPQVFKGKNLIVKLQETEAKPNSKSLKDENIEESRTVLVTDLPEGVGESAVHIHFQKKKAGGGEVEKVIVLEEGNTAMVVFEDPEVATRVVNTPQKMKEKSLTVSFLKRESLPERKTVEVEPEVKVEPEITSPKVTAKDTVTPESVGAKEIATERKPEPEIMAEESRRIEGVTTAGTSPVLIDPVFSMVTATVNSMLMNTGTQYFWSEIFNVIQRTCGVQCQASAYGVMITGKLSQVTKAGDILQLRWRKLCEDLRVADQGSPISYHGGVNFNQSDTNLTGVHQYGANFNERGTIFHQSSTYVNQFHQSVPNFNQSGSNASQLGMNLNQRIFSVNQYDANFDQRGENFKQPDTNFDQRDPNFQQCETNFNQRENFYPVGANSTGSSFGDGVSFNSMGYYNQPPVTKQPASFVGANTNPQQFGNRPNLSPGYIARFPSTNVTDQHGIEQPRSVDSTSNLQPFKIHFNKPPDSIDRSPNSNMERDHGSMTCSPDVKPKTPTDSGRYSQPAGNPSTQKQPSDINRLPNSDNMAGDQDNESKTDHPYVNAATSPHNARYLKTYENLPEQKQPSNMDKFYNPNAMRRDKVSETRTEQGCGSTRSSPDVKAKTTTDSAIYSTPVGNPSIQKQPSNMDKFQNPNAINRDQVSETRKDPPASKPLPSTDSLRSSEPSGKPSSRREPSKTSKSPNSNTMENDQVSESRTSNPHVNAETSTESARPSQLFEDPLKGKEPGNVHTSCNSNATGRDKVSETRTEPLKRGPLTSTDSARPSQPSEDPLMRKEPDDIHISCNSNTKEQGQYSDSGINPPEDKRATSPNSTKNSQLLNKKQNGASTDNTNVAKNTTPTMQGTIPHGKKKTSQHDTTTSHPSVSLTPNISTQAQSSTVSWSAPASDHTMDPLNEKPPSSPCSKPSLPPPESERRSSTPNSSTEKKILTTSGDQVESPSNVMADSESDRPPTLTESTKDHQQIVDHQGRTITTASGAENLTTVSNPLGTQSNKKPEIPDEKSPSLPKTTVSAPPKADNQLGTDSITKPQNSANSNNDDESPLDDQPDGNIKKPPAESATTFKPLSDDETASTENPAIGSLSPATSDYQNGKPLASTSDSPTGKQSATTENLPSNKQQQHQQQQHQNTPDEFSKQQTQTHEQGNVLNPSDKSSTSKNQIPHPTVEQTQNSNNTLKARTPVPLPRKKNSGTNERRQNAATFLPPAKQPGHDSPRSTEPDTNPLNAKPAAATESRKEGEQEGTTQNPETSITTEKRDKDFIEEPGHDCPASTEPDTTNPSNGKPTTATKSKEKGEQEGTTQNPETSITTEKRDKDFIEEPGHDCPASTEPDTTNPSNGKPTTATKSKEKGEQEGTTQNPKTSITTEKRDENLTDDELD